MTIITRLSLAGFSIVALCIALLGIASYFQFLDQLAHITQSRLTLLSTDALRTIKTVSQEGILLKDMESLQKVVDGIKNNDPHILSVQIFDISSPSEGRTAFHSRNVAIGGKVPPLWIEQAIHHQDADSWQLDEDGVTIIGTTIKDSQNHAIGGIVIRHNKSHLDEKAFQLLQSLVTHTLLFLLGGFLMIRYWFGNIFLKQRIYIQRVSGFLNQALRRQAVTAPKTVPPGYEETMALAQHAIAHLAQLHKDLEKLHDDMSITPLPSEQRTGTHD